MYYEKVEELKWYSKLWVFMHSYSFIALLLGIAHLVWCILYKLVFINIPAIFEWSVELSEIYYNIALSIIASVIFYFITVYIPEAKKHEKTQHIIYTWLFQLKHIGMLYINDISGKNYNTVTLDNWKLYSDKDLTEKPTVGFCHGSNNYNNWFEYFEIMFEEEDRYIEKILSISTSLPISIIEAFHEIQMSIGLRSAVAQYKEMYYTKGVVHLENNEYAKINFDYTRMKYLDKLIWERSQKLRSLINTYQRSPFL